MAFISALHQICQLISGFSSLVFFCIVFYLIRSPVLSCGTPQPHIQSLTLVVLYQQRREEEESLQEIFVMLLMDGAPCLWSVFQYYVSGVGGEQPLYSLPSLPPFSVVSDVLQSWTVSGEEEEEEEKPRKVAKHDFIRFDFKLNEVS